MGILVAIEGLDGAGKNTIVNKIMTACRQEALKVRSVSFPSYGWHLTADLAAEALHGEHGDLAENPQAMALLFALDRQKSCRWLWRNVRRNDVLLCDRYVASNAAYSAARLNQGPDGTIVNWIKDLEFGRFELPTPDHQLLLGVPPEIAMQRATGRAAADATRAKDAYERDADLQTRVYRAYLDLADTSWMSPWTVADGDAAVETVLTLARANKADDPE